MGQTCCSEEIKPNGMDTLPKQRNNDICSDGNPIINDVSDYDSSNETLSSNNDTNNIVMENETEIHNEMDYEMDNITSNKVDTIHDETIHDINIVIEYDSVIQYLLAMDDDDYLSVWNIIKNMDVSEIIYDDNQSINMDDELISLFYKITEMYVQTINMDAIKLDEIKSKMMDISQSIQTQFQSILNNYNESNMTSISYAFYKNSLRKYFKEPNPPLITASDPDPITEPTTEPNVEIESVTQSIPFNEPEIEVSITIEPSKTEANTETQSGIDIKPDEPILTTEQVNQMESIFVVHDTNTDGDIDGDTAIETDSDFMEDSKTENNSENRENTLKVNHRRLNSAFNQYSMNHFSEQTLQTIDDEKVEPNMLELLTTSPTNIDNENFDVQRCVNILKKNLYDKKHCDHSEISMMFGSLSENQRLLVKDKYNAETNYILSNKINEMFTGELKKLVLRLISNNIDNDCYWINKGLRKNDFNRINETILCRTVSQIKDINIRYKNLYNIELISDIKKHINIRKDGNYFALMTNILAGLRDESTELNFKSIKSETLMLYNILDINKTLNKSSEINIINILTKNSWFFIKDLCKRYSKKSTNSLKSNLEKKFGNKSKIYDALGIIIDFCLNRYDYFAKLLQISMKGLNIDHSLMIRVITNRCSIDLGDITIEFTNKYGNGKTLLQCIKDVLGSNEVYKNLLLKLCGIGDFQHIDVLIGNMETIRSMRMSIWEDKKNWDDYIKTSPTIRKNNTINYDDICQELITTLNKNNVKSIKSQLTKILTNMDNEQIQITKKKYKEMVKTKRSLREDIKKSIKKGNTLTALIGLLNTKCELDSIYIQKCLKNKDFDTLSHILCTRTNYELEQIKYAYKEQTNKELQHEISIYLDKKGRSTSKLILTEILKCDRIETVNDNSTDVMNDLKSFKKHIGKTQKNWYANFFAKKSWTHISHVLQLYDQNCDINSSAVLSKVFGNGISYTMCDIISKMGSNRHNYFAKCIYNCISTRKVDLEFLILIILSRCEIDLGDIITEFNESINKTNGKTLKEWINDKITSGPHVKELLLRICGLYGDMMFDNDSDTKENSNGNLIKSVRSTLLNDDEKNLTEVFSEVNKLSIYDINPKKLGQFIQKQWNQKFEDKMWKKLKTDNKGFIKIQHISEIIAFIATVYIALKEKMKNNNFDQNIIKQKEIKNHCKSMIQFLEHKLSNHNNNIKKIEMKQYIPEWLFQYKSLQ